MLPRDVTRLSEPYCQEAQPEELSLLRLAGPLSLDLAAAIELGDEIVNDLDNDTTYGIGWWRAYRDLDRKTRILLSDYLVACARAVPSNLVEAQVERLELDHAAHDFAEWMARGLATAGQPTVEPARSPYEDLAINRVHAHLAGALRAWGSALDCVEGCVIGVAGLSANLVKADLKKAREQLEKQATKQPGTNATPRRPQAGRGRSRPGRMARLAAGMRNTFVHRGRRTNFWVGSVDPGKPGDFSLSLRLPVSPDLTEVEAIVASWRRPSRPRPPSSSTR